MYKKIKVKYKRRQNFIRISKLLKVNLQTDWYKIKSSNIFYQNKIKSLQLDRKFRTSLLYTLADIFPEVNWIASNFIAAPVPNGYWNSESNLKIFIKQFEKDREIKVAEDWYQISTREFKKSYPSLYQHHGSICNILKWVYPNNIWFSWRFKGTPKAFWFDQKNIFFQRQFFQSYCKENNLTKYNDIYSTTSINFSQNGGSYLMKLYKSNLSLCFNEIFCENIWYPWNFVHVPSNFWENSENVLSFLSYVSKIIDIQNLEEWNKVSHLKFKILGGGALLKKFHSVSNIVSKYLLFDKTESSYTNSYSGFNGGKSQFLIFKFLQKIFPDKNILENYQHPNLMFKNTNKRIELDLFIPNLQLAFEYQGKHHYENVIPYGNTELFKKKDLEKKILCSKNKITLIEIPYLWDTTEKSLRDLIKETRPDIL